MRVWVRVPNKTDDAASTEQEPRQRRTTTRVRTTTRTRSGLRPVALNRMDVVEVVEDG